MTWYMKKFREWEKGMVSIQKKQYDTYTLFDYNDWDDETGGIVDGPKNLYLSSQNLKYFPASISSLNSICILDLSNNLIRHIPDWLCKLSLLKDLYLYHNLINIIPDSISELISLRSLHLSNNHITTIPDSLTSLTNLTFLHLNDTNIASIPESISNLTNLHRFDIANNLLTIIPYYMANLRYLSYFDYRGNPINHIAPNVTRLFNRTHTSGITYHDAQSVHKHSIQDSIRRSISNILPQPYNKNILHEIQNYTILTEKCKMLLSSFVNDASVHTELDVTFSEVLDAVWSRIQINPNSQEIKKRLCEEMDESQGVCFTGRISRLINCLNGFDDMVIINIDQSEQIGTIISLVGNQIKDEYKREKHIEIVQARLRELDYDEAIIQEWIGYI